MHVSPPTALAATVTIATTVKMISRFRSCMPCQSQYPTRQTTPPLRINPPPTTTIPNTRVVLQFSTAADPAPTPTSLPSTTPAAGARTLISEPRMEDVKTSDQTTAPHPPIPSL